MDEQPQTHPLVLYDGTCGFCKIWIEYWKLLTKGRVDYASSRERGNEFPGISRDSFARSVQLVQPGGAILDGAKAVFTTLAYAGKRWPLWLYENVPLAAPASEAAYRAVASHRNTGYWLTAHTFGRTIRASKGRACRPRPRLRRRVSVPTVVSNRPLPARGTTGRRSPR